MTTVQKIARAAKTAFLLHGIVRSSSRRRPAGRRFHLHVHVLPHRRRTRCGRCRAPSADQKVLVKPMPRSCARRSRRLEPPRRPSRTPHETSHDRRFLPFVSQGAVVGRLAGLVVKGGGFWASSPPRCSAHRRRGGGGCAAAPRHFGHGPDRPDPPCAIGLVIILVICRWCRLSR